MPRRRHGEMPLPEGWDYARDFDGKVYFIDHNNKKTTWIDPRDRFTKPVDFADCVGDELPLGWEMAFDPQIGAYYINHVDQCTQLEDPRLEWREKQEIMLREYLQMAHEVLEAKKEIYDIKQQRLHLAQDEYNHLNNALATLNTSRTSLCSSSSSVMSNSTSTTTTTKYDPDLLKSDVALARNRVSRLKCELEQIRTEMTCTQRGVETLTNVEQKLNSHSGGCYNISEAQAIMTELRNIQKSLSSGEKEKAELMQSLAKLKDDLTRLQLCESSPDASTLSIHQEKLSTASQTDLSELVPIGTRLAEMAKIRLEYDEARKRVQDIQQKLADLEDKVQPGQVESDKDRLLLFQEKEQLLKELRSITPRTRTKEEMFGIEKECKRLEQDLNRALEMSNRAIADRLRLHEEKQFLLQQLRDGLKAMTVLESQLKSLSVSTLSVSSSSSLGSLSTTSSKGSLSSGLSFTDIYGIQIEKPIDMQDLHRRVNRLLSTSATNDPTTPPLPTTTNPQPVLLSPISETPTTNSSSVSAAVSDESVAGDSGVFEASRKRNCIKGVDDDDDEAAVQVQIKLRYSLAEQKLFVGVERARNLDALCEDGVTFGARPLQLYIKVSLLPNSSNNFQCYCTKSFRDYRKPTLGEIFPISVPLNKLYTKTLQINICCALEENQDEECLGCAQVSLADFNLETSSTKWYNILSFRFLQPTKEQEHVTATSSNHNNNNNNKLKEESSDESTIISSQTSTLTRNQDTESGFQTEIHLKLEELANCFQDEEDVNSEDDEEADEFFAEENSNFCLRNAEDFQQRFCLDEDEEEETFCLRDCLRNKYCRPNNEDLYIHNPSKSFEECFNSTLRFQDQQKETPRSHFCYKIQEEDDESKQNQQFCYSYCRDNDDYKNQNKQISNYCFRISEDFRENDNQTKNYSESLTSQTSVLDKQKNICYKIQEEESESCFSCRENNDLKSQENQSPNYYCRVSEDFNENITTENCSPVEQNVLVDKQTNTECAFFPEQAKQRKLGNTSPVSSSSSLSVKRSQTFSPRAHQNYICKLNRSESDSSMPLYRGRGTGNPFQRNSVERRSLRWRRQSSSSTSAGLQHIPGSKHPLTTRTSLDLELDLQAQHTRLHTLHQELSHLRTLKQRLEVARTNGDMEVANWALEDPRFLGLLGNSATAADERKVERLFKKTAKEVYKLRKMRNGFGKLDVVTFQEKMAFFTRVNNTIPIPPTEESKDVTIATNAPNISSEKKTEAERYDYVVDRVLGVEV